MRSGVRLGIDLGQRRVGVARSDASGLLAVPVETVTRGPGDIAAILTIVAEYDVIEVVLGLPRSLSGGDGPAAEAVRAFAGELASACPAPVRLVDERMSTVAAQRSLHQAGRTTKSSRSVVDQAAAVVILQTALDGERATGNPPGELVRVSA